MGFKMSNSGDNFNYGEGTGSSPNKIDFLKKIGKKVKEGTDAFGKAKSNVISTIAGNVEKGARRAIKGAAKVVGKVGAYYNKGKSDDTKE